MQIITLSIDSDAAEPILRDAAAEAAKFSALFDHIGPRTYNPPINGGESLADARKRWQARFLKAKHMVEAFGVEYEQTSEAETLTVHIPMKNQKRKTLNCAGVPLRWLSGGVPDPKRAMPAYRGGVHSEACQAAAARTVARWRASLG